MYTSRHGARLTLTYCLKRHWPAFRKSHEPTAGETLLTMTLTDVWVALDGEVIVGWATTSPGRDDDAPHPLELEGIYVLASHYGSGTGQSLLHASIAQRHVYLWMAADNPRAGAFYRRNGFRHDGTTKTEALAGEPVEVIRLSR